MLHTHTHTYTNQHPHTHPQTHTYTPAHHYYQNLSMHLFLIMTPIFWLTWSHLSCLEMTLVIVPCFLFPSVLPVYVPLHHSTFPEFIFRCMIKIYISLDFLLFNVLIFNQFHILYTQQLSFEHSPLWQLLQKSGIPILYDHSEKILETFHHSSTPHYFTTYVSCLTPNTQTASFFKNAGTCTPVPQVFFNL